VAPHHNSAASLWHHTTTALLAYSWAHNTAQRQLERAGRGARPAAQGPAVPGIPHVRLGTAGTLIALPAIPHFNLDTDKTGIHTSSAKTAAGPIHMSPAGVGLHMPTGMQTTAEPPSASPPHSPTSASAMSGFSPCPTCHTFRAHTRGNVRIQPLHHILPCTYAPAPHAGMLRSPEHASCCLAPGKTALSNRRHRGTWQD
jgi:hypothetical protein